MKKFPLKLICFADIHFSLWADAEMLWGFPGGSAIKNPPAYAGATGDTGSVPGLGRSPGGGNGNPLQYSCLEYSKGKRSLAVSSPWGCRVRHDLVNKQ